MENQSFTGNVERAIQIGNSFPATVTAEKPVKVGERDGAFMFSVKMGIVVDTRFPTKAGNVTTALIVVPLDGGKEFPINGGKVKMDGIPPFIYGGRGVSQIFTTYADNGDVVKRKSTRRSAQAEIEELNKKIDNLMAAMAAMVAAKK